MSRILITWGAVLVALIPILADASGAQAAVPPVTTPGVNGGLLLGGAIEAPEQPSGRSSAGVKLGERVEPVYARGHEGAVHVRVRDLVAVRGQEQNVIQGVGLVTGLSGTGDTGIAAKQAIRNLMLTQNINLDISSIASNNVAVVWVEATLPPGIKPGRMVNVRVSALYDCESLVSGTLVRCELTEMSGTQVYATASGAVSTGGFSAGGEGATVTRNHLTVGTIPLGGRVEREVPTQLISEHGYVYLDMRAMKGSFGNAVRIADSINDIYRGAAVPVDAMTVRVAVPGDLPETAHVAYLDSLLTRQVEPESMARIVINERTGVIVMGEGVAITRGAITKGNLTVSIAETAEASQPGPFSGGSTEVLSRTELLVEEEDRPLSIVNGAVTLNEVVEVLNVLGVSPRDMIQILQSMGQSGMLHADVVVM
jgi:flagellar P-ring protein precursor FlgI